jgi:hypothetical protein
MRSMWVRIGVGAGLVFGVGMMFLTLGRQVKAQVSQAMTTGGRVSVPLSILPFHVDHSKVGSIKRIDVNRDATGARQVHVVAKLSAEADTEWLSGCLLQVDGANSNGFFSCVPPDAAEAADLVVIGDVTLEPGNLTRPIVVTPEVARKVFDHGGKDGSLSLTSDGQGTRLQVTAGENGAFLKVRDEQGNEVVRMRAGAGGVEIKVKADSQP